MTQGREEPAGDVVLRNVTQGYGKTTVLHDLTVTLGPGITALVGPNGAGKTTLMRTVTTSLPPRSGTLAIAGTLVAGTRGARRARRRIGYLPQDFGADPRFTVRDYITYLGWLRQVPKLDLDAAVEQALSDVDLKAEAGTAMKKLSGGMRQRAGIAGAIVGRPHVVVLDEPTVGLDPAQRLGFRDVLRGLSRRCVLLSTHLIEDVAAVADRVLVMSDGDILFDGTVQELSQHGDDNGRATRLENAYLAIVATPAR